MISSRLLSDKEKKDILIDVGHNSGSGDIDTGFDKNKLDISIQHSKEHIKSILIPESYANTPNVAAVHPGKTVAPKGKTLAKKTNKAKKPVTAAAIAAPAAAIAAPASQTFQQPFAAQTFQQPFAAQTFQQPLAAQTFQQPFAAQTFQQPPAAQTFQQPPAAQHNIIDAAAAAAAVAAAAAAIAAPAATTKPAIYKYPFQNNKSDINKPDLKFTPKIISEDFDKLFDSSIDKPVKLTPEILRSRIYSDHSPVLYSIPKSVLASRYSKQDEYKITKNHNGDRVAISTFRHTKESTTKKYPYEFEIKSIENMFEFVTDELVHKLKKEKQGIFS